MAKKPTGQAKYAAANYDADSAERPAGERWVTQHNALIRAGNGLTLSEKRLIAIAASKLNSYKPQKVGDVPSTRISAAEYAEQFNVDHRTAYEALKAASQHLYSRSITFYEMASRRRGKPLEPTVVTMRWVGRVHYQRGEGWVELYWWPQLLPYLTGLRNKFTSYQLEQASALRSIYSWRLLELLKRFADDDGKGWAEYTIEDFATSMDATENQRANFNNIRRRIIEPAVKELTEKDDWKIEWEPIKSGRRVSRVRFKFQKDNQLRLSI
jgi:plasmid replication initiation protein|uniref:RepA n=1 Tax=Halomonas sp. Ant2 TaxID=1630300 RepID=A0A0D5MBA6_9GAMM|nr:replication initiation protein [Halomonas sp. Ant2]AJY53638.1 RepA [Halomonas sp. Ant2]|tara:strand:+ start:203 stop:1009 length:807 start_codon:yes stop_codon:yes gene_type:complete